MDVRPSFPLLLSQSSSFLCMRVALRISSFYPLLPPTKASTTLLLTCEGLERHTHERRKKHEKCFLPTQMHLTRRKQHLLLLFFHIRVCGLPPGLLRRERGVCQQSLLVPVSAFSSQVKEGWMERQKRTSVQTHWNGGTITRRLSLH